MLSFLPFREPFVTPLLMLPYNHIVEVLELLHLLMVGLGHNGSLATVLPFQSPNAFLHDILSYYFDAILRMLGLTKFMMPG